MCKAVAASVTMKFLDDDEKCAIEIILMCFEMQQQQQLKMHIPK